MPGKTMASDRTFLAEAFDLVDEITRLDTCEAIGGRVSLFVERFGIKHLMYTRLPLPKQRLSPYTLYSTWPRDFLGLYDSRNYYQDDPIADHAFQTLNPYLWSDVAIDHDRFGRARQVMGEAADAGLRSGFCVPIHDAHGFQAVVTMAGSATDLLLPGWSALNVLSLVAFGAMDRHARPSAAMAPLSRRERELLVQLAAGRTLGEAADRMGLAGSSASTLLVRARQKLGTTNTVHTVVEALRLRQIRL